MTIQNEVRLDRSRLEVLDVSELDRKDAEDVEYWRKQPIARRLEAIERLRQISYGYDPTTDRLPRLLEIVEPPDPGFHKGQDRDPQTLGD